MGLSSFTTTNSVTALVMDASGLVDEEFAVDLESGRSHDGSVCSDDRASLVNYDADQVHSVVIDVKAEGVDVAEMKLVKEEKRKKTSNKKASKPPRPPRGPSLDSADLKFIREITELTMLKRIRTERIKALKKMKAAKTSSSSNSLFATMFTVIFCCVILLQGISNRNSSHASIDGSPSSLAPDPGLISVQYAGKVYAINSSMLISGSPSYSIVEQVSGQDRNEMDISVSG